MKEISIEEFVSVVETLADTPNVDAINVCTHQEYAQSHIDGVRNVPLDELADHIGEFEGKRTVYVHCRSGRRSAMAAQQLVALGVMAEVVNVAGGLNAWENASLPTKWGKV